jgi:DNA polymerase elongation subunit (family B)
MEFKELVQEDLDLITKVYKESESRKQAQSKLAIMFNVTERTIRNWVKYIGIVGDDNISPAKILIYDIETGRVPAMVWWTGKQYVNHNQLIEEPKIITIAYKWLGENIVYDLTWDKNQSDKDMITQFMKVYNKADMVIGQNNDRFDNRWVNARAMKYDLEVNTFVRSFDIMKETKRLFRLPSYSMAYITNFLGVETKLQHEGIIMWDKIQFGTKEEQAEYLQKMVDYNRQDIVATEDMYLSLRKYMGNKVHFGVLNGNEKFTCPLKLKISYNEINTSTLRLRKELRCN